MLATPAAERGNCEGASAAERAGRRQRHARLLKTENRQPRQATTLCLLQGPGSQRDGAKHALVTVAGGRNNVRVDIVQLRRGDVAVVEL